MTFKQKLIGLSVAAVVILLSAFWQWRQSVKGVAINSSLARIATLQYNLLGIRGQTLNQRRQNPTVGIGANDFREFFVFEFENLRFEMGKANLDDQPRWNKFAETWNLIRTTKNVLKYRLQFADEAQAVVVMLRDEQSAALRSARAATWLLSLGLGIGFLGFGWLLYSQRKQLSGLQAKTQLSPSEVEQEKSKALNFYAHAVREPLETLKLGMEQVKLTLQASERTLAVPVEPSLFDNPLYVEKTDLSRRQVSEAQQLVQTLIQSQLQLEKLTNSFIVHQNEPATVSFESVSLDELLNQTLNALNIQAEENGVAVDLALRCDSKSISTSRDELLYCVQQLAAHVIGVAQGSMRADRRVIIALWDGPEFWNRFVPGVVMSDEQIANFGVLENLSSTPAVVLIVADSGDVVNHHDENGEITKSVSTFSELDFIVQTARQQNGFAWCLQTAVEPDYCGTQWALYWPLSGPRLQSRHSS